jgi:hypothetical protein
MTTSLNKAQLNPYNFQESLLEIISFLNLQQDLYCSKKDWNWIRPFNLIKKEQSVVSLAFFFCVLEMPGLNLGLPNFPVE